MNGDKISLSDGIFKLVFENSGMAITVADEQERLILWNRAAEQLLQMDPGQLYLKPVREFYPASEWQRLRAADLRKTGGQLHTQARMVNAWNKTLEVDLSLSLLRNSQGAVQGSIAMFKDVTERKKAEQAFKKPESFGSSLLDDSPNPILMTNLDSSIKYVNRAFIDLTGFSSQECIGLRPPYPWWPEKLAEDYLQANIGGRKLELNRLDRQYQKKNGQPFWVNTSIKAIKERGETKFYMGSWTDVTEHKQMEDALQESEAKFRNLVECAPSGISITDYAGKFHMLNKSVVEIYGYDSPEELMGAGIASRYVREEDRRRLLEGLEKDGAVKNFEVEMLRKDGKHIWCSLWAVRQVPARGEKLLLCIVEDITERRTLEVTLKKAKETAELSTQAKSDFLAHMSHEIRTPMNAIVGLSHLCLKTELTSKQRDYLNKIQSSANSLMGIINDILDLSKVEAGKIEIESEDFRLDEVFANLANSFGPKVQEKGLALRFKNGTDLPLALKGDALRLGQILTNLVGNAVKFTDKGEITITTQVVEREGERVKLKIAVRDTGIGISSEHLSRLFQPFVQADGSTTRRYGGTGLGLIISRKLARLMGGDIEAESTEGEGSTFSASLVFGLSESKPEERARPLPEHLRGLKVLVADDDPGAAQIISQMLSEMNIEVTCLNSGKAVLQEVQQRPYDLLLLDWRMPDMDGFETVRRIRSKLDLPKLPRIFLITAYGRQEAAEQAKSMGLDAFLVKPISYSMLRDAVLQTFCEEQSCPSQSRRPEAEANGLKGASVLLVEDNEVNQQVARELLEGMGLTVDIAGNGKAAVEMLFKEARWDAVLMDLQMPEMDGYQATRLIRGRWSQEALPVIAMTAHVLRSEIDKCLEAGMNDYVAKPVDPGKLQQALSRWIKNAAGVSWNASRSSQGNYELTETIPGIDLAAALKRLMGNRSLFDKLLYEFVVNNTDVVERVRAALERGDDNEVKKLVHTLKGAAGNLSAMQVFDLCQDLESSLREVKTRDQEENLIKLENALAPILKAVMDKSSKGNASQTAAPRSPQVDARTLGLQLQEMDGFLKRNNLNACRSFRSLKTSLASLGMGMEIAQMESYLDRLDFKSARRQLFEISKILGVELSP